MAMSLGNNGVVPSIEQSDADANIQKAISLLHPVLVKLIQSNPITSNKMRNNKKPDFSHSLLAILNNWNSFYPPGSEFTNSKNYFTRANRIRHLVAHQAIDCNTYQHNMECLAKVATAIGEPDKAQIILKLAVVEKEEANTPKEENDTIDVANETKKDDWTSLKQEGNQFFKQNRWREAMNCYTRAIHLNQEEAVLYSNRALCELQLSKFLLAHEDIEDAIQLDPKNVKYYRILSEALLQMKMYTESLEACQQGLQIDPNDDVLISRERKCRALLASDLSNDNLGAGTASRLKSLQITSDDIEDIPDSNTFKERQKLSSSIAEAHELAKMSASQDSQARAFDIFEAAAKKGSAEGLYNMAKFYSEGKAGLPRDSNRARELFLKATSQKAFYQYEGKIYPNVGVADAECFLGNCYRDGRGVKQCSTEAFKWYLKAAKHDCPTAQYNVGNAYFNGDGCRKDEASARSWFQKAAKHGLSEAQSMYAGMVAGGRGGPLDIIKAAKLFQLSADQGNAGALERLQMLYKKLKEQGVSDKEVMERMNNLEDPFQ